MSQKGTSTFIIQRATAALLIPLGVWFVISMVANLGANYMVAREWLAQPVNAVLFALFIAIGAWHMRIGLYEIIADYIHGGLKSVLSAVNWIACIALIAGVCWSIYNISFAA